MRLRILHNGNVNAANPHWCLWIDRDGKIYGELIGPRSEFRCIQEIQGCLESVDADTLFRSAETMRPRFSQRHLLPDDVMVELRDAGHPLWRFAVPQEEQHSEFVADFFAVLRRVLQRFDA